MTGHIDCAELLLTRQGWSPSRWQKTKETPLHLAVRFRHDEFAKRLVAVGGASQWEEVDNENLTPREYLKLFDFSQLPRAPRSPPDQKGSQETEKETRPDWQCLTRGSTMDEHVEVIQYAKEKVRVLETYIQLSTPQVSY